MYTLDTFWFNDSPRQKDTLQPGANDLPLELCINTYIL